MVTVFFVINIIASADQRSERQNTTVIILRLQFTLENHNFFCLVYVEFKVSPGSSVFVLFKIITQKAPKNTAE